jgi:hypothetical protein
MNVQDVITRIRRTFGDEAAVQIQDADIIRWINDGQVEIVKNNEAALQKTGFVDLVAGTSQYALPTDLMILRTLRYKYTTMPSFVALKYMNMQQFDESIDSWDGTLYGNGSPQIFTLFEGKATLFPTPDQSATSGLKVLYNQKPSDVALITDSLSVPLLYHNTIVSYCMWQASLLDEEHEPALMYQSSFQQDMRLVNNQETRDPMATYSTITTLSEDL